MTIQVALQHRTVYRFERPVRVHPHTVRLRPAPHCRTPIRSYSLTVEPHRHFVNWQQDPFGNHLARLVFPEPVAELDITVDIVADMTVVNPFDFFVEDYAQTYPFGYPPELAAELAPYCQPVDETVPGSGPGPLVLDWIAGHPRADRARAADRRLPRRAEPRRPVRRVVHRASGGRRSEPRPHVEACRGVVPGQRLAAGQRAAPTGAGRPVRVRVPGAAGRRRGARRRPGRPVGRLHRPARLGRGLRAGRRAGSGWTRRPGCSPARATSRCRPPRIPPRRLRSPGPPRWSAWRWSSSTPSPESTRTPGSPAPTRRSSGRRVDQLGRHIDDRLAAGDVRLTMGGEPTFVAVGDTSSAQWQFAADGEQKRALAA